MDFGSTYQSVHDIINNLSGVAPDDSGNVAPSTTTINRNEDGSHDITHKFSVQPGNIPSVSAGPAVPTATAPAAPVAPASAPATQEEAQRILQLPQVQQVMSNPQVQQQVQQGLQAAQTPEVQQAAQSATGPVSPDQSAAETQRLAAQNAAAAPAEPDTHAMRSLHVENLNNNPAAAITLAQDQTAPKDVQHMGALAVADNTHREISQERAQREIAAMDPKQIATLLQREHPEGSWAKYMITGMLGLQGLNQREADKLGLTDKTVPVFDAETGRGGTIRVGRDGTPLMGINEDGTVMKANELQHFYTQSTQQKVAAAKPGAEYVGPNGEIGRLITRNLPNGRTETMIESGGTLHPATNAWRPMSVENAAAKAGVQTTEQGKRAEKMTGEVGKRNETKAQITETHAGATGFNRAAGAAAGRLGTELGTTVPFAQMGTSGARSAFGGAVPATTAGAPGVPPTAPTGAGPGPGANPLPPAMTSQANVPGTPPAYNPALSPMQNKEIQKNWSAENKKILTDFAPGGAAGKQIIAIGTATNHINDDFKPLVAALKLGNYPAANAIAQKFSTWSGSSDVTNAALVGQAMADEVGKTLGGMALADRKQIEERFRTAQSKEQLEGAIKFAERLMAGKTDTLREQYERSGRRDFYTNVVQNPHVKDVVDQIHAERNISAGTAPQGSTKLGAKWKVIE